MNWEQVRKLFIEWFLSEYQTLESDFKTKIEEILQRLREQNYVIDASLEQELRQIAEQMHARIQAMISYIVHSVNKTAKLQKDEIVEKVLQEVLEHRWDDGLNLSERFWNFSEKMKEHLKNTLIQNIRADLGVKKLMYDLQYTIENLQGEEFARVLKEAIPKWLEEFEKSVLGLLANKEMREDFKQLRKKIEKYIEKRSREGTYFAGKQLLKEVEKAVSEGKKELLEKAVRWWLYDKQLYRLKTIAWTESAHAYLRTVVALTQDDPDVAGYQWRLSRSHPRPDICDVYANVDYGLGRGVHPKDKLPPHPAHPHCMCYLVPITRKKGMKEKELYIPEEVLESWAPRWLRQYAAEKGLSLRDLFDYEKGRFLRRYEVE